MNTLDKIHSTHTSTIKENKNKLSALKKSLHQIEEKIEYHSQTKNNKTDLDDLNMKRNEIVKKIMKIENNGEMFEYYMKTGTLLFQYYDRIENVENVKNIGTKIEKARTLPTTSKQSVISYFQAINTNEISGTSQMKDSNIYFNNIDETNHEEETQQEIKQEDSRDTIQTEDKITNSDDIFSEESDISENREFDSKESLGSIDEKTLKVKSELTTDKKTKMDLELFHGNITRESLRNLYLEKMEILDYKKSKHNTCVSIRDKEDYSPFQSHFCKECLFEMACIVTEGVAECPNCGLMENIMIDSDKPSYRDIPKETNSYSYRRSNHFNEWIAQFQAKERTQIPRKVIYQIIDEIKKERIQNLLLITPFKIRSILKKLKLNKFYEHIPHIINQINGKPPPVISRQTEERLRGMFSQIQNPFLEFCPKERKNFLSYSYVLHKFVELLDMAELKPLFPLLKSREKLFQCDLIWKPICKKLNWTFYKSI
jgi:hypothetical protein